MKLKSLLIVVICLFFSACSMTSQKASLNNQLKVQNVQLQRQLNDREAEIVALKQEISTLMGAVNDLEGAKFDNEAEDDNFIEYRPFQNTSQSTKSSSTSVSASSTSKDDDIIRVNVDEKTVQTALKNAGYYSGNIDGKIGKQSKAAITKFQKDHALTVDGIVGGNTWSELKTYLD